MNNCTCHICTTSVKDLLHECFIAYLFGNITIDEYAELTEHLKQEARNQINKLHKTKCYESFNRRAQV